jgi:hypothetical protein
MKRSPILWFTLFFSSSVFLAISGSAFLVGFGYQQAVASLLLFGLIFGAFLQRFWQRRQTVRLEPELEALYEQLYASLAEMITLLIQVVEDERLAASAKDLLIGKLGEVYNCAQWVVREGDTGRQDLQSEVKKVSSATFAGLKHSLNVFQPDEILVVQKNRKKAVR